MSTRETGLFVLGVGKVRGAKGLILSNYVYTCHDLGGSYFLHIIKCSFASSRVIYDGWKSEFISFEPLRRVLDAFSFKKHVLVVIDSRKGAIK